jgi:hypothetical protein
VTREITDPDTRARALSRLATVVADITDHDQALALTTDAETATREITDPDAQTWALSVLVAAVVATGDHDRAVRLAREITNPDIQAQVLSNAALTILQSGKGKMICQKAEVVSLKTFLAEAICTSSWLWALPALAQLDPLALQATCDVLLTRTNSP